MRIDFVITELEVGGAEKCLTEIAVGLSGTGESVRVFSIAPLPTGNQSQLVDRLRSQGIELVSGKAARTQNILGAAKRLSAFFAESKPDVCQTFMFHANVLGTWCARKASVPVVVGGLRVAEHRTLRCAIESMAVKRMDSLVCVSEAVAGFANRQLKCPPERLTVIPNAVDIDRFSAGETFNTSTLGWPNDAELILFVGRLHPQKGLDLIQNQINRLVPPDSPRRLLLVGDGNLRPNINQWCQTIGNDRVRLMPWQADIAPLIRRCNLLLLPSRYEGMPNVVLEAMAASRPVVCSRVEGIQELLGHDPEQTFDIGDDQNMADLVDTILSSPKQANAIGKRNHEVVKANFSIPIVVDAYHQHYRQLLKLHS